MSFCLPVAPPVRPINTSIVPLYGILGMHSGLKSGARRGYSRLALLIDVITTTTTQTREIRISEYY